MKNIFDVNCLWRFTVVLLWFLCLSAITTFAKTLLEVTDDSLSPELLAELTAYGAPQGLMGLAVHEQERVSLDLGAEAGDGASLDLVVINRESGAHKVLSLLPSQNATLQVTPLLMAELGLQGLGSDGNFNCFKVRNLRSSTPVVLESFSMPAQLEGVRLPRFLNKLKGKGILTELNERTLIRVSTLAPRYLPVDNSAETQAEIKALCEQNLLQLYHYLLPDGTHITYHTPRTNSAVVDTLQAGTFIVDLAITFTAAEKAAITYALEQWSQRFSSLLPIHISLDMVDLGSSSTLAVASTYFTYDGDTSYPLTLYNHMEGHDYNPGQPEYLVEFNTRHNFFFSGSEPCPGSHYDFVTVFMHELTHGLGFTDTIQEDGSYGIYGRPSNWDAYLYHNGQHFTDMTPTQRQNALISNALFWDGPFTREVNDNIRPKIYAPSTYASGSTGSHWDSSETFHTFMKYSIGKGTAIRVIGEHDVAALQDIGWFTKPLPLTFTPIDEVETYTAFAVDQAGTWSFYDGDNSYTWGIEDITFDNENAKMAFMVFNPSETDPPLTYPEWAPFSGAQYFACFAAVNGPNNDWLISPELNFTSPFNFAFTAKSLDDWFGMERFKVGYSTTDANPASFVFITSSPYIEVPAKWTHYNYLIPANARYVAINCVSDDAFVFMVDDLYIGVPSTSNGTPYYWLDNYSLVSNGDYAAADIADPDGDGFANYWEYRLGLHPGVYNTFSLMVSAANTQGNNLVTAVKRLATGTLAAEGPGGTLSLYSATAPGGNYLPLLETMVSGADIFDSNGVRVYTNQMDGATRFFRAVME